jgi:DNA-binding transcriptional MerR regulator
MEDYKSIKEISEIFNLPRSSIYFLIKKFNIKSKKRGLRRKLYDFNQFQSVFKKYYEK